MLCAKCGVTPRALMAPTQPPGAWPLAAQCLRMRSGYSRLIHEHRDRIRLLRSPRLRSPGGHQVSTSRPLRVTISAWATNTGSPPSSRPAGGVSPRVSRSQMSGVGAPPTVKVHEELLRSPSCGGGTASCGLKLLMRVPASISMPSTVKFSSVSRHRWCPARTPRRTVAGLFGAPAAAAGYR